MADLTTAIESMRGFSSTDLSDEKRDEKTGESGGDDRIRTDE